MGNPVSKAFSKLAQAATNATGSPWAFMLALTTIIVWAVTGPTFHFSDTWQLVINTSTTIITFLMVFVIQHSQNKDMKALQIKLDELISSIDAASNELIDVQDLSDEEVDALYKHYQQLAADAGKHPAGSRLSPDQARDMADKAQDAAFAARKVAEHAKHRAGDHRGHRHQKGGKGDKKKQRG
jgi:low affinity Fe/Cu permease